MLFVRRDLVRSTAGGHRSTDHTQTETIVHFFDSDDDHETITNEFDFIVQAVMIRFRRSMTKKERPTNCGTKAADVPDYFPAGKHKPDADKGVRV